MLTFREAEGYLKAVGEETRLKILSYLALDSFCVCELVELLQMSQPSISQHLRRLRQAEIISEERKGKWVYYSLNQEHELYSFLLSFVGTLPSLNEDVLNQNRIICE